MAPGGLFVVTGFEEVNDWLRCVGVDSRMAVQSAIINIIFKISFKLKNLLSFDI